MAEQHRATASEWASVKALASGGVAYSCLLELRDRIEALEARNEDDKEAWAARLRRPGRSQAERIASLAERITSLVKRIDDLEAAQRAINQSSTNRIHLGLGDTPEITSAPASSLSAAVNLAASEAFRADSWIACPDEVAATTEAQPNYPAKPDSSLVKRVALAMNGATEWQARAAIREVAAWLGTESEGHLGTGLHWAKRLQREAER